MAKLSANQAKARFGELLDRARQEPITIEKHGRAVAVVISSEEYERLQKLKLERLRTEVDLGRQAIADGDFVEADDDGLDRVVEEIKAAGGKTVRK